eukprot:scaffold289893_cov32-Tisochrysis_lutea.AAC.1
MKASRVPVLPLLIPSSSPLLPPGFPWEGEEGGNREKSRNPHLPEVSVFQSLWSLDEGDAISGVDTT